MSKYDPLAGKLNREDSRLIPMSFDEIEGVLGFPLPNSARTYRPWWSNSMGSHVQAKAWLSAGYKVSEVNLEGETVVFRKQAGPEPAETVAQRRTGPHPLIGCLKGLITLPDDLDLTQPADPNWGARTYGRGD
jgi:hypothetical protein